MIEKSGPFTKFPDRLQWEAEGEFDPIDASGHVSSREATHRHDPGFVRRNCRRRAAKRLGLGMRTLSSMIDHQALPASAEPSDAS